MKSAVVFWMANTLKKLLNLSLSNWKVLKISKLLVGSHLPYETYKTLAWNDYPYLYISLS